MTTLSGSPTTYPPAQGNTMSSLNPITSSLESAGARFATTTVLNDQYSRDKKQDTNPAFHLFATAEKLKKSLWTSSITEDDMANLMSAVPELITKVYGPEVSRDSFKVDTISAEPDHIRPWLTNHMLSAIWQDLPKIGTTEPSFGPKWYSGLSNTGIQVKGSTGEVLDLIGNNVKKINGTTLSRHEAVPRSKRPTAPKTSIWKPMSWWQRTPHKSDAEYAQDLGNGLRHLGDLIQERAGGRTPAVRTKARTAVTSLGGPLPPGQSSTRLPPSNPAAPPRPPQATILPPAARIAPVTTGTQQSGARPPPLGAPSAPPAPPAPTARAAPVEVADSEYYESDDGFMSRPSGRNWAIGGTALFLAGLVGYGAHSLTSGDGWKSAAGSLASSLWSNGGGRTEVPGHGSTYSTISVQRVPIDVMSRRGWELVEFRSKKG